MFGVGGDGLATPFAGVPRTSFNRNITGARRFVAQSWSLERVRAMGKAYDGTINDAVLGMCAGAMRKYLQSLNVLPDKPLKAMAPRLEEHTSELQSLMRISYDVFCLQKKKKTPVKTENT